jgi:hypothetical protein
MKKKLAIVNQRYGLEVNGGAESHTRQLAEHLQAYYDIEVLTSCALDYMTWENYYPEGIQSVNGIAVRRFKSDVPRVLKVFGKASSRAFGRMSSGIFGAGRDNRKTEEEWIDKQGPCCSGFIKYL